MTAITDAQAATPEAAFEAAWTDWHAERERYYGDPLGWVSLTGLYWLSEEFEAVATGAQELLVTTITHDHRDRLRSFELLAQAWGTARLVA